ncbi:MAG TPA: hypothetical protein VGI45_26540 [Terracidiphilus sp.]|jgi:hypothetical protein
MASAQVSDMADEKALQHALTRFRGFRSHVSGSITEAMVDEYHSILSSLQKASGDDLARFYIPRLMMREHSAPPVGNLRHPTYSRFGPKAASLNCDKEFFMERMDRLSDHFESS